MVLGLQLRHMIIFHRHFYFLTIQFYLPIMLYTVDGFPATATYYRMDEVVMADDTRKTAKEVF